MTSQTTSAFRANSLVFFDQVSNETILPLHPLFFEDDFLGAYGKSFPTSATAGSAWCKKLVQTAGSPAVTIVSNGPGGQAQISVDNTSEDEEAVLYFLDNLCVDVSKIGGFEVRFGTPVIPNGVVQAVLGMQSSYVAGPDNNTCYVRAGLRGNGAILAESYDGTTTLSQATGTTIATTTEFHIFRGVWNGAGAASFFLDGNELETNGPNFSFNPTGSLAVLQPYLSLYKASGTGVGTLAVDYFRVWGNRT